MLEFIRIQRFKTLMDASFPLASLNLFSGLNGMGKSSLVQALLLLRQSYERNTLGSRGLLLQGDYTNLGVGRDVLAMQADENSIEFLLKWQDRSPTKFQFGFQPESNLQPQLDMSPIEMPEDLSLFNRNFQYLSADRIGPKSTYETSDYHIGDLGSLGNHGEYTAHFIAVNALKSLPVPGMVHPAAVASTFLANLEAWMSEISPGLRIRANVQPQTNTASLAYAFVQDKDITADFKPQNVGFGLTYVLPVVVAILRAKPGDLLIIENPESHLHPAGQAAVGRLCALAASHGIQLIVESHSDHFLNSIRIAVKCATLLPEQASLFFLQRPSGSPSHSSIVIHPQIDIQGRLDQWPEGFFDEWEKSLERLL